MKKKTADAEKQIKVTPCEENDVKISAALSKFGAESTAIRDVEEESAGQRLDVYIGTTFEDVSRNAAQKLIEDGRVFISGKPARSKKQKVCAGDTVKLILPVQHTLTAVPENIPVKTVYEDGDVLVVDKPRGMVVHPAAGSSSGTLANALMYHCKGQLSSLNGDIRPGIVHRIDKDTTGLIVIVKNDASHAALAEQLKNHTVTREYTALAFDNIKDDSITIDEPIGRDERNRLRRAVDGANAKPAITHISVMKRYGRYTLVSARLETGRTHQIRVHMAYIKHPLVGDTLYSSRKQPFKIDGQLLHANLLGFVHPATGEYMEFKSDLPVDFSEVLTKLER